MAKYTISVVTGELGVDRSTIYRWIREGRLKAEKDFRGITVVDVADVEKLKANYKRGKNPQEKLHEFLELIKDNGKFTAEQTLELVKIFTKVM